MPKAAGSTAAIVVTLTSGGCSKIAFTKFGAFVEGEQLGGDPRVGPPGDVGGQLDPFELLLACLPDQLVALVEPVLVQLFEAVDHASAGDRR